MRTKIRLDPDPRWKGRYEVFFTRPKNGDAPSATRSVHLTRLELHRLLEQIIEIEGNQFINNK